MDSDFISEIPQSVIETILTKLPIRDAVKTSMLSSCWRSKWAFLTDLVFDDRSFSIRANQEKIVNFITRCLFLHEGPIHKFSLSGLYRLKNISNINQWLIFISYKGIKELNISLCVRIPYSLFSCLGLTRLELSSCELDLHPDFRGFPLLKCLDLDEVSSITPGDIEFLISNCPLLESLSLTFFDFLKFTVQAPNLKQLVLNGELADLCLGSMPLLVDINFTLMVSTEVFEHLTESSWCTFEKLFGGVPNLERLTGYITEYMSIGNNHRRNPITFHHLKSVELREVAFDLLDEVVATLQILVNSPVLETLQVSNSLSRDEWSMKDFDLDVWAEHYTFCVLRTIKMTMFDGSPYEMKFLEFLLKHSPSLEMVSIVPRTIQKEEMLDMTVRLGSFQLASSLATINYAGSRIR